MDIETQPRDRNGAGTSPMSEPERGYPFEIDSIGSSRLGFDFEVTLRTSASKEEIYELMRTQLVPIAMDRIEPVEGGLILRFPDHVSGRLAGEFFHAYWAAMLTGQPNRVSTTLSDMKVSAMSQVEGVLDPNFYSGLIERYYKKIDQGDNEWVIAMFAPDAVYARADTELKGRDAIAEFYRGGRKISGTHHIDEPIVSGDTVIVRGVFNGVGADGSTKHVRFSDIWRFEGREVKSRETYLALNSDYVKE